MGRVDPLRADPHLREARAAQPPRLPGPVLSAGPAYPALWTPRARSSDRDVFAQGQNSLDRVGIVDALPAPGAKVRLRGYSELPGGQVATASLACARLGLRVAYAGRVGDDPAGDAVLAPLRAAGVDLEDVTVVPGVGTRLALVLVDRDSGERTVLEHRDPKLALTAGDLRRERIASARAVLLDATDPEAAQWVAEVARQAGVPVVLDADAAALEASHLAGRVDFPLVSRDFAEAFYGAGALREALADLASRGARLAAVTLGEHGVLARCGDRVIESPAFRVDARDTTGAGDVFRAGFVWALLAGRDAETALRTANAAAAMNCRAIGAQGGLPTAPALERFLRDHEPEPWREP